MSVLSLLGQVWILIPVALLLLAGFAITLRSGVVRLSTTQGVRQLAGNFTQTALMLGLSVAVLMLAQSVAGFNLRVMW